MNKRREEEPENKKIINNNEEFIKMNYNYLLKKAKRF